jgi:four helix bundle protein
MENTAKKHGSFEDLQVYEAARAFRKQIYKAAKSLPDSEKYNLNLQMRRAAVSLTNNIAEGHGRFHYTDNVRFVLISRGSLEELSDDLNVCEDEAYLALNQLVILRAEAESLMRQINGYIRYLRERKAATASSLQEEPVPYRSDQDEEWPDAHP